jgi:hypothetical protein
MSSGRSFFGSNTVEFMLLICRAIAGKASQLSRDEELQPIEPARALAAETLTLERRLSAECGVQNAECPAEIALLCQTAPPRMPIQDCRALKPHYFDQP